MPTRPCLFSLAACCAAFLSLPALAQVDKPSPGETAARRLNTDVWTAGKLDLLPELLAADFTCTGPTPEDSPSSVPAYRAYVEAVRKSWNGFTVAIGETTSKPGTVTMRWTVSATYAGSKFPAAKGRKVVLPGTSVYAIAADGRITSERASWDTLDLQRQLGVEETTDEREATLANARRLLFDVYSKGDYAAIAQVVTDDYQMHVPAIRGAATERGAKGVEARVRAFRAAFPDLQYELHDHVLTGDTLVLRWSFRGTHRGEFLGVAPSGKPVAISGLSLSKVRGGRIAETWAEWDRNRLLEQIGATPPR